MTISKKQNGKVVELAPEGRLDTITAPELDAEIAKIAEEDIEGLVLNFEKLEYISSAGLRVLLNGMRAMEGKGGMKIINACELIQEVFSVTGFDSILDIE